MQIDVIATCGEARAEDFNHKTAVVIDVLRATSNMVTALAAGCASIVPTETVQQAKQAYRPADLLGGERSCKKIPGFDLGNSPFEYRDERVRGKRIVMTTTNGTRAVQKASRACTIIACAFLNVRACAEAAILLERDVVIVCSGTQDEFSWEDGLCAGLLIEELMKRANVKRFRLSVSDLGLALRSSYLQTEGELEQTLLSCANGVRLRKLGFYEDIVYCAQRNRFDVVPVYRNGELVAIEPGVRSC
jgi:2-phosphosulfolactate phosphatase